MTFLRGYYGGDCFIDDDPQMALVVDRRDPRTGAHQIIGVGRLTKHRDNEAELPSSSAISIRAADDILHRIFQEIKYLGHPATVRWLEAPVTSFAEVISWTIHIRLAFFAAAGRIRTASIGDDTIRGPLATCSAWSIKVVPQARQVWKLVGW